MQVDDVTLVHDALLRGELLPFVGAGISKDPPAGLPDWHQLRNLTLEAVASRDDSVLLPLLPDLTSLDMLGAPGKKGLTPEVVASDILDVCNGYFESFRSLEDGTPNFNHQIIARLAKLQMIQVVITTNFDLFLERALDAEQVTYRTYRSDAEFEAFSPNTINVGFHLFKLHGCISLPATITATVAQEGRGLSAAKSNVLRHMIQHYTFAFWGYSGADLTLDTDYLQMVTMKTTAKGFVWDQYSSPDNRDTPPDPAVLRLQALYADRGRITTGLLPDTFASCLPPHQQVRRVQYSSGEQQAWVAMKNQQLRKSLFLWADQYVDKASACTIFGHLCLHSGKPEHAVACWHRMAEFSRSQNDQRAFAAALQNLGDVYKAIGDNASALKYLTEARNLAQQIDDPFGTLIALGEMADILGRMGRYDEALRCYHSAESTGQWIMSSAESIGLQGGMVARVPLLLASIYDGYGDIFKFQGFYDEALKRYRQSEELTRTHGEKRRLGATLGKIGMLYRNQGQFDKALPYFEEEQSLASTLGDRLEHGYALRNIGSVHMMQGELTKAESYLEQALVLARSIGEKRLLSVVLSDLSLLRLTTQHKHEALQYAIESAELAREIGELRNLALGLRNIASMYRGQDNAEALRYYQEAVGVADRLGDQALLALDYEELADLHQSGLQDLASAVSCWERAFFYYCSFQSDEGILRTMRALRACRSALMGIATPSLFELLSAVQKAHPTITHYLETLGERYGVQAQPFVLEVFCAAAEARFQALDAPYRVLVDLKALGDECRQKQEPRQAIDVFTAVSMLAREIGDRRTESVATNDIGLVYVSLGDTEQALQSFLDAERLTREIGDLPELISRLYNIGTIYERAGSVEIALRYYQDAELLARQLGEMSKLLTVLLRIAEMLKLNKAYDRSLPYYVECERLCQDLGDEERIISVFLGLGKIYREQGKYLDGIRYRAEVAQRLEAQGKVNDAAPLLFLVANSFEHDLNQLADAISYYERALSAATKTGDQAAIEAYSSRLNQCRARLIHP